MKLPRLRQLFLSHVGWPRSVAAAIAVGGVALLLAIFLIVRDVSDRHEGTFAIVGEVPAEAPGFATALLQTTGVEMRGGHRVELVDNGAVFDALVREIERARTSVHIVMYIWEAGGASDRVVAALAARVKAGVRCRVVVDGLGSSDFLDKVQPSVQAAGCEARILRPLGEADDELARNHRKIVVVDGQSAMVGGFGIRDNWLGDGLSEQAWRDSNVVFEGPAVRDAQLAFAESWQEAGGALLAATDLAAPPAVAGGVSAALVASSGSPTVTRAERLIQLLTLSARRRVWIANAYFVPTRPILEQLERQAQAGVDVRILVPGKQSDSKTSFGAQNVDYGGLVEAGIRVWEYQPAMMHSKTMLVDDRRAMVGSINIDPLSLNTLDEVALVVDDPATNARLAEAFERDCQHAKEQHR
ncbi:MAG: phospholipase D-like domain-containing protein [Polyangiaceae bacterium]